MSVDGWTLSHRIQEQAAMLPRVSGGGEQWCRTTQSLQSREKNGNCFLHLYLTHIQVRTVFSLCAAPNTQWIRQLSDLTRGQGREDLETGGHFISPRMDKAGSTKFLPVLVIMVEQKLWLWLIVFALHFIFLQVGESLSAITSPLHNQYITST